MQISCSIECAVDEKVVPVIFSSNDIFLKHCKSELNPFCTSVLYYYSCPVNFYSTHFIYL